MATTIQQIELPKKARAVDTSGNNNHGQIYSGRGLEFDGIGDYLSVDGGALDISVASSVITVVGWFNSGSISAEQCIWNNGKDASNRFGVSIKDSKLQMNYYNGSAYSNWESSLLSQGVWYRFVAVLDGSGGVKIYINGILDYTTTTSSAYRAASDQNVGMTGSLSSARFFDGMMSNLQIWDAAFTQADVTYDYLNPESLALNNSGTALTESNLKLWYPMQDGHRGQQSYILDGANSGIVSATLDDDFSTDTVSSYVAAYTTSTGDRGTISYVSDGFLRVTYTNLNGSVLYKASTLVSGKTYKITFRAKGTHDAAFASVGNNADVGHAVSNPTLTTDWQDYEFYITANGVTFRLYQAGTPDDGQTFDIDDILIKPVNDKHHATTVFYGDDLWDIADNNVSDWVATAATSVASSEVAIGGTTDGVKLIYGSQSSNHGSYAQLKASKFLSEDLTVGRKYTLSGLFATDVVGNTNAPGVAVYASGWTYPTGFASASANIIPATNLITNGTMEVDDNWTSWSDAGNERSDTQAHNGTYSRKFTPTTSNDGIQSATAPFTTVTGTTYLVSFWIYPDDGTVCSVFNRKGGEAAIGVTKAVTGLTENAWNKVEMQFTEDVGGTGAYIAITSSTQTSGDFYVDDVVVTAFLEREITFTATTTTGDYLAALNIPSTAANDLISQVDNVNSILDGTPDWQAHAGAGGTASISYDATEDEVTFETSTNTAIEGMKLTYGNYSPLEIGRTYTVKINMRAASGTPTVRVYMGASSTATATITTSDVDYSFSVTPTNLGGSLFVTLADTTGIDITVSKIEIFPNCNLYVDDLSFKEIGVASGWTDADQQLHIPQTALQSYNELAWFDGTSASNGYVDLDTQIATTDNDWSLSFWVYKLDTGAAYNFIFAANASTKNISLDNNGNERLSYRATGNAYHVLSDAALPHGEWIHVVITANADTSMTAYINGVAQTTNSDMSDTELVLSRFMNGYSNDSYNVLGTVNEISYYSDVLTAAEALDLFNDGKAKSALELSGSAELVGYWRNNGLSEWKDLKGSNDGNTTAGVVETILIPQGVDSTRDAQGFIMNKQKSTSCLNFPTRSGDYVEVGDNPTIDFGTGDFSYECWAQYGFINNSDIGGTASGLNVVFSNGLASSSNTEGFNLLTNSSKFLARIGDGAKEDSLNIQNRDDNGDAIAYVVGDWYNIAVTRTGTTLRSYVDGAPSDYMTNMESDISVSTDTPFRISDDTVDSRDYKWPVDSVKLYNKELSDTEVLKNYNATKGNHRN